MMDFVAQVARTLKLTKEQTVKLRSTADMADADSLEKVAAVLAGIRRGEANTVTANAALTQVVEYPQRVDECPICYAHMTPVTLAEGRAAYFCPVHNVAMPAVE